MSKIIAIVITIVFLFLLFGVLRYSLSDSWIILFGCLIAIPAVFRESNRSKVGSLTLNLIFMTLILGIFSVDQKWNTSSILLFLNSISVSLIIGSVESLFFSLKIPYPALNLLFVVGFWTPLVIPLFFMAQRAVGIPGGIAISSVLFFIVVRDMQKRKEKWEKKEQETQTPNPQIEKGEQDDKNHGNGA